MEPVLQKPRRYGFFPAPGVYGLGLVPWRGLSPGITQDFVKKSTFWAWFLERASLGAGAAAWVPS